MLTLEQEGNSVSLLPEANSFSVDNALFLAQISNLAYGERDPIARTMLAAGFSGTEVVEVGVIQFLVSTSPEGIVVGFRGTRPNHLQDWALDSKAATVAWDAGKVHMGFLSALDSVWPAELLPRLRRALEANPGARLWFTGHSLGGALAELATARSIVAFGPEKVAALYTFGKPRVGNEAYSAWCASNFGARSFRCVYRNDIVPTVPSHAVGFRHVGEGDADLYHFDESGALTVGQGAWQNYSSRLSNLLHHIEAFAEGTLTQLHPDSVPDHELGNYLESISKVRSTG